MDSAMEKQLKVKELLRQAQQLESKGQYEKAVAMYRAAAKLDARSVLRDVAEKTSQPLMYQRSAPAHFRTFPADVVMHGDDAEWKAYFDEHGYIVVDGVLTPEEVDMSVANFGQFIQATTGCDIHSAESLKTCHFGDPETGIVGKSGIGQSRFSWFIRSRPAVKTVFRKVIQHGQPLSSMSADAAAAAAASGEDKCKLITSFDGCNWMRNPERFADYESSLEPWFHFDAGDAYSGRHLQGLVNVLDTRAESEAGLVVLPGSHRSLFPHIVPESSPDAARLAYLGPVEDQIRRSLGIADDAAHRVPMAAGSMVIWRSTVLHCNTGCMVRQADQGRNPEQLTRRLVAYVCMMRDPLNAELTERRREVVRKGQTSTHEPDLVGGAGHHPQDEAVAMGAVITDIDALPDGALELL